MRVGADRVSEPPRVSVIIPHYNMTGALERCLASVKGQSIDHGTVEIIVVDNNSSVPLDGVRDRHRDVLFLAEPRPGPGMARNTGATVARAPLLAFIDADCRAERGWLQAAIDALAADGERAVAGGDVQIDFVDPKHLTGIEAYEAVFAYRQAMYIRKRNFSGTGNLAMAATVYRAVGPFAGIDVAEDLDWGQRATGAGFRIRYAPDMIVYHPARTDFASLTRKWQRHIRHDWVAHQEARRPTWRWWARSGAMLVSIPVDAMRLLVSRRLRGLSNRFRGIGVLAQLRLFRAHEMIRATGATNETGATFWNPTA